MVCDHIPNAINFTDQGIYSYTQVTNTVTFSGIDVPITVNVQGYEDDQGGYIGLGQMYYSLNGGADQLMDIEDEDSTFRSYNHTFIINSGNTLKFSYYNNSTDPGGNFNTLNITVYRETGAIVSLDTVTLTPREPE